MININIPVNNINPIQKKIIIKENHKRYIKATRKQKTLILNDLVALTGYSRKYIIYLLNLHNRTIMRRGRIVLKADITKTHVHKRGRKKVYTEDIAKILFKIWIITGGMSSKHLKAFIEDNYDRLWEYSDLRGVPLEKRILIREISPSTIDRLLKPKRDRFYKESLPFFLRKRKKKSAHLIKGQIGIEIWKDKLPLKPGYIEIDLVEHNGGNPKGEFIYTLCGVDIKTYWVFLRPLKNKARVWTKGAVKKSVSCALIIVESFLKNSIEEMFNFGQWRYCFTPSTSV